MSVRRLLSYGAYKGGGANNWSHCSIFVRLYALKRMARPNTTILYLQNAPKIVPNGAAIPEIQIPCPWGGRGICTGGTAGRNRTILGSFCARCLREQNAPKIVLFRPKLPKLWPIYWPLERPRVPVCICEYTILHQRNRRVRSALKTPSERT